jgi:hypothetical protein
MLNNLKALVVVLPLAFLVFRLARPICLRFMEPQDFDRRMKVWFALTITVFASPSFYVFAVISVSIVIWAARRDNNPAALFVFLFYAAPNVQFDPIHQLFPVGHVRLLTFSLLIPALVKWDRRQLAGEANWRALDFFIVSFCLLQVLLFSPYESITACIRRGILLILDQAIPFMVLSRVLNSRKSIVEAMAAFVLAVAIMTPIGLFESLRSWLLYVGAANSWGAPTSFAYLLRAGRLRAQVSTGHSIAFGCVIAMAFGFWLYLQRELPRKTSFAVSAWLWVGAYAGYARGPWLVSVIILFSYLLMIPSGFSKTVRAALVMGAAFGVLALTPIGEQLIDILPFVGSVDSQNVLYRQTLFDTSIELIKEKPWFGDRFVMLRMEHLRQGQGIIDLVNGYLYVALFFGVTGLFLVGSFLTGSMLKAYIASINSRKVDADLSVLGSCIGAVMLGMMIHIYTAGWEPLTWSLAGIAVAYARIVGATTRQRALARRTRRLVTSPN